MSSKIKKRPSALSKRLGIAPQQSLQEALSLHQAGQWTEAEDRYRKLLAAYPRQVEAMNLLATLLQQRGEFQAAIPLLEQAHRLSPERADILSNLGSAWRSAGDRPQAILTLQKALALQANHLESQFNLGMTLFEQGDFVAASHRFAALLHRRPDFIPALEMLGHSLLAQDLLPEALTQFQAITRLHPGHDGAFCQIGDILQGQGQLAEAAAAYQRAIALAPNNAAAHNNLGNTLVKQGQLHAAMGAYQEARRCDPDLAEAAINLGWTYMEHGMIDQDIACLADYLKRHPEDYQAASGMLFSMNYDPSRSPAQLLSAAKAWGQRIPPPPCHPPSEHHQPLRIGFLSPDFREHPVGTFLLPLFEAIGHDRVSLRCYAEMAEPQRDAISDRLQGLADSWFSTMGLSASEAARVIRHDQLDILIDLAGHSAHNRLDIMAQQAAPKQASWLGYVGTTGLPVIDYRLTDSIADPPGAEANYSEALLRLPDAFFCYAPPAEAPEIGPLPALSQGHITFGSLNTPAKLSAEVIALWASILLAVPDSQLILVGKPFADTFIRERYLNLFAQHGVEAQRLMPITTLPLPDYLALYNRLDLALDPFPHNGHTISCHTLWMGVPLITLAGDRYASRMGASILSHLDLPELIAPSQEAYRTIAIQLASDLDHLAALRQGLRSRLRNSVLCDSHRFAKNFVAAMQTIQNAPARQNGE